MTNPIVTDPVIDKAAPVAVGGGVSVCTILGYPLPDVVQWLTLFYVFFSILKLFWGWAKEIKKGKDDR